MNIYRLRVFPGRQNYLERVISQNYYINDFRINFYNTDGDDTIVISSYPSSIVIIESITYNVDKPTPG